jgi:hypothetical protein
MACLRHRDTPFSDLSEVDQILVAIWELEGEVNKGGFVQYYYNYSGNTAYYAPIALRRIGAKRMADIVDEANSHFGPGGPPISQDVRQMAMFEITELNEELWHYLDEEFYRYPDDITTLLGIFLDEKLALRH